MPKFPTISIILSGGGGMGDVSLDEDVEGYAKGTKYEGYTGYAEGTPARKGKGAAKKGKGKKSLSQMIAKQKSKLVEEGKDER